jgi:hypothetical protein
MNPKPQPSRQSLGPLPAAIVAHLTSAVGVPTPHLLVDGQPQVHQDGWTLGESQIDDTEGEGHITDVEVCLLKSGAILTSIVSISADGDSHAAHVHGTPEEAAHWLNKHCHGYLEAPAQAAWRQACETLPALLASHSKK